MKHGSFDGGGDIEHNSVVMVEISKISMALNKFLNRVMLFDGVYADPAWLLLICHGDECRQSSIHPDSRLNQITVCRWSMM